MTKAMKKIPSPKLVNVFVDYSKCLVCGETGAEWEYGYRPVNNNSRRPKPDFIVFRRKWFHEKIHHELETLGTEVRCPRHLLYKKKSGPCGNCERLWQEAENDKETNET